jgi:hypothetical protein
MVLRRHWGSLWHCVDPEHSKPTTGVKGLRLSLDRFQTAGLLRTSLLRPSPLSLTGAGAQEVLRSVTMPERLLDRGERSRPDHLRFFPKAENFAAALARLLGRCCWSVRMSRRIADIKRAAQSVSDATQTARFMSRWY